MNLTIKNNSGQKVYTSMYGLDNNLDWVLYNFTSNTLDICVTGVTVAMDYMTLLGTGLTISNVPQLASGIVLFSYNELPNDFAVVPDAYGTATVQSPSFLTGTSDFHTVFNMVEFTLSGAVWIDITNVDYFSTPIEISLSGTNPSGSYAAKKGAMNEGRNKVFSNFLTMASGTPFENLVISKADGTNVRILAPQHGVDSGLISANYWDKYVNSCWKFYQKHALYINTGNNNYICKVNPKTKLLEASGSTGALLYTFQKPAPGLADDIFGCAGTLAAPNNELGAIAARIGAAINRSTLLKHSSQPDCTTTDFYKLSGSTNLYACILHKFYTDGTTYAFPFDDVCNGSSTLSCTTPEDAVIELGAF